MIAICIVGAIWAVALAVMTWREDAAADRKHRIQMRVDAIEREIREIDSRSNLSDAERNDQRERLYSKISSIYYAAGRDLAGDRYKDNARHEATQARISRHYDRQATR